MASIWFTSDYHLGHAGILRLCNRPFREVDEMAETIIERHNAVVAETDEVYDLGDFAFRCEPKYAAACLGRLNGRRKLLWGNHDKALRQALARGLLDELIASGRVQFIGEAKPSLHTILRINVNGQPIVLSHYGLRTWQGAFRGAWHVYGHSRGNLPPFHKSFDVGVDANEFHPVSFEGVRARMELVRDPFAES